MEEYLIQIFESRQSASRKWHDPPSIAFDGKRNMTDLISMIYDNGCESLGNRHQSHSVSAFHEERSSGDMLEPVVI